MTDHHCFERVRDLVGAFWRARSGNLAVTFALAAIPVVGAVGAAVDLSKAGDVKTQLQNSLDAAVLAGVAQPSANQISTANSVFSGDFAGKFGTTATPSFVQNADNSLSGTVSTSVKTSFMSVLGPTMSSIAVSAAATAKPGARATTPVCILLTSTLDAPSLLVNSGAVLNAPTCEVHVLSTQSPAATFNTSLNAKRICIKGSSILKNGTITPSPVTSCAAISDPFANTLPTPDSSTCTYSNKTFDPTTNLVVPSGTYCGWTNFNGSGSAKLSGLYVIKNGGMTFNSGWTITGTDVTFYLVDQNATITFNGNVNASLAAPTSGTYANILMFEPTGLSSSNLPINGTSGSSFTGLMYLPSRKVTINSVSNVTSNSVSMVFSTLTLNATNWSIAPGALSMSAPTGTASTAYLSK